MAPFFTMKFVVNCLAFDSKYRVNHEILLYLEVDSNCVIAKLKLIEKTTKIYKLGSEMNDLENTLPKSYIFLGFRCLQVYQL